MQALQVGAAHSTRPQGQQDRSTLHTWRPASDALHLSQHPSAPMCWTDGKAVHHVGNIVQCPGHKQRPCKCECLDCSTLGTTTDSWRSCERETIEAMSEKPGACAEDYTPHHVPLPSPIAAIPSLLSLRFRLGARFHPLRQAALGHEARLLVHRVFLQGWGRLAENHLTGQVLHGVQNVEQCGHGHRDGRMF